MITAAQLRAARALLGLDQRRLAELSGLSVPTIQRMEASDGVIRGNVESLMKLIAAPPNFCCWTSLVALARPLKKASRMARAASAVESDEIALLADRPSQLGEGFDQFKHISLRLLQLWGRAIV